MVESTNIAGWWPDFYEPFRSAARKVADWMAPVSEASNSEDGYEIVMELPGVEEKDIDVQIQDGVLTIRGEKRSEKEEKGKSYYFSERSFGMFKRSFRLPEDAYSDKVSANIKDGVLRVLVPRSKKAETQPVKVEVNKK